MTADEVRAMQNGTMKQTDVAKAIRNLEREIKQSLSYGHKFIHVWWGDVTCNDKQNKTEQLTDFEKDIVIGDFKKRGFDVTTPRGYRSIRIAW